MSEYYPNPSTRLAFSFSKIFARWKILEDFAKREELIWLSGFSDDEVKKEVPKVKCSNRALDTFWFQIRKRTFFAKVLPPEKCEHIFFFQPLPNLSYQTLADKISVKKKKNFEKKSPTRKKISWEPKMKQIFTFFKRCKTSCQD